MATKSLAANYMKAMRDRRRLAGLCSGCGGIPKQGYLLCPECHSRNIRNKERFHYAYNPVRQRIKYLKKIVNDQCFKCGKPLDREGSYCKSCVQKQNKRTANLVKKRKELRLCRLCGKSIDRDKGTYCNDCRKKEANRNMRIRNIRLQAGLCQRCGKQPFMDGLKQCLKCSEKGRLWRLNQKK